MSTHRLSISLLFFLFLLCLSGCTMLGPDFRTPDAPIPEQWTLGEDPLFKKPSREESVAWWTGFNDPVLNRLITTGFQQNLGLRVAALRIMEARAQLGRVRGYLFPQVQQASGALTTTAAPGLTGTDYFNAASIGFDAGWELDFWGKYRRGVESAEDNLLASMADYEDILVSLSAEVARTYITICTLEERIRLARKNAQVQERGLQLVQDQLDAGMVTELDILQATTLLASTRAAIPNLQATLFTARHALAVLLGMLPAELNSILPETEKIPEISPETAIGAPAELLRRRPDVRRAEMLAAAQSAQIGIARSDLFPSFTLFGTLSWSATDSGGSSLDDIFDSNHLSYGFGPSFTWNLFNYGRLKNQVRIQDARLQQLVTKYQNTVLSAAREVEDAMSNIVLTRKQADYIRQTIISSRKSMELAMLQYEEGFVDYQRVLDSTRSLTQKQDQYATLQGAMVTSVVSLYKAMGGGWQVRQGKPYLPDSIREKMQQRTDWGSLLDAPVPTKK